MNEQLLASGMVLLVLLFLRFGGWLADSLCDVIDPPPDLVREYPR